MRTMPLLLCLALFACGGEDDPMNAAPTGGGGGGGAGGGSVSDAMASNADAQGQSISGQLCLVEDLRRPKVCGTEGDLSGISIEDLESGNETVTDEDGKFEIAGTEKATTLRLKIGFDNADFKDLIVPLPANESAPKVPAMTEATWLEVRTNALFGEEPNGTASIAAYILDGASPAVGVGVATQLTKTAPVYDGDSGPNDFQAGILTGTNGVALLFGMPTSSAEVSFSVSSGSELEEVNSVPVLDGALTFIGYRLQ
tara:strand:+ start:16588 stop:17355 length:768 start_codon:yes stop_codon:yes gene_type:complete